MGILDILFPKYCVNCKKLGSYLCTDCFSFLSFDVTMLCLACGKNSIDGLTHPGCRGRYTIDGCFSSIRYRGIAKKLLYQFKYKPYVSDLTNILTDLFYEGIIQHEQFVKALEQGRKNVFMSPIPLHKEKFKKRGYNHAEYLGRALAKKLKVALLHALVRTKNTRSQFGLSKKDRRENIHSAFATLTSKESLIQGSTTFLVDDILTTGATISEAARILKKHGADKVWGITLARD